MERLISIVTPFYNESESITAYLRELLDVLKGRDFELICVDDGSTDDTLEQLLVHLDQVPQIKIIEFARNFGKEAALSAGLQHAQGHCIIILDADLQDPPQLIPKMLELWEEGAEIVLAKRLDRRSDTPFKRMAANSFYRIYNYFAEAPIPENVGDFRLMDRKVVEAVLQMPERNRFMKGVLSWPGFSTQTVKFERPKRAAGTTKWSFPKLLKLSVNGILAFSDFPLKLAILLGVTASVYAISYAVYLVFKTLWLGIEVPGYASLMVVTLILGGLILICLGIIGEYLSRIYLEVKQRPLFVIRNIHAPEDSVSKPET